MQCHDSKYFKKSPMLEEIQKLRAAVHYTTFFTRSLKNTYHVGIPSFLQALIMLFYLGH
jgi:hypothetical protein